MRKYAKKIFITAACALICFNSALAEEKLSWQDCIGEAAKNNPNLIAAVEEINQSVAAKNVTASALYPQIDANLSASTARTASDNAPASTADSYSYGVSATQLIFDGTKTIQEVKAASETVKSFQQNYRYTSTTVRLSLRTAFVNLLKAQELVLVSEDIVRIRRDNLQLIALRYASGLEHRGALLTAEANLAQANFQLSQAKRSIELAQWQLTKEMGRKQFIPMSVQGEFKVVDSADIEPDLIAIADKHPSLLQITAQKNSAEFSLRSAYANFSPTLTGAASADKNGTRWTPKGDQWGLGLTLSMPIFEGGLRLAQVSQAQGLLNQLRENERNTRDGLIVNLASTWKSLRDAIETVDVQYKNLIATQERSKISSVEFSTGFISYDNWTIIEDNLVSAKTSYLNAQASALLAEANWIQAKGEALEYAKT